MNTLSIIHLIFVLIALTAGALLLVLPKGTRWHRTLGHIYFTNAVGAHLTVLPTIDQTATPEPLRYLALTSLVVLAIGILPVLFRYPKDTWLGMHMGAMLGSYVGLVAAAAAEVASRIVDEQFFFSVIVATSAAIILVGVIAIHRYISTNYDEARRTHVH